MLPVFFRWTKTDSAPYEVVLMLGPRREAAHMSQSEPVNLFKNGLTALQNGYSKSAVIHLRKAFEHDSSNPFYVSYYGLALARAGDDWAKAEDLCQAALRMKSDQPDFYVNLAEVYRRAGSLEDALKTLYQGLHFTQWDSRLVWALERLGVRRRPVLAFLDRNHFINRQLGKLRRRIEGPGRVSALESLRIARN
jgi:tetratricopeptide (TPR) repeat protein